MYPTVYRSYRSEVRLLRGRPSMPDNFPLHRTARTVRECYARMESMSETIQSARKDIPIYVRNRIPILIDQDSTRNVTSLTTLNESNSETNKFEALP
jgi:hypothetical protein